MQQSKQKTIICLNKLEKLLGIQMPRVTVFNYHSISDDNTMVDVKQIEFKKHIGWLKENFNFISLDQVVDFLKEKQEIFKPSVALTFDDGYQDVLTNVIPILKKHNIPATFFVLSKPAEKNAKELENNKKLLTIAQIKKLHKEGWDIGCHSATHEDLVGLNDKELEMQIVESKKVLEKKLSVKIKYFAYPKGHYSDAVISCLKKNNYEASFGIGAGIITNKTNKYLIPRISIDRTHTLNQVKAFLTNWARLYLKIKEQI